MTLFGHVGQSGWYDPFIATPLGPSVAVLQPRGATSSRRPQDGIPLIETLRSDHREQGRARRTGVPCAFQNLMMHRYFAMKKRTYRQKMCIGVDQWCTKKNRASMKKCWYIGVYRWWIKFYDASMQKWCIILRRRRSMHPNEPLVHQCAI
jgi:hypothetical protein